MSIAVTFKWNVYVFLVFIFIDGCCGSWVVQLSISMAMVSDLTSVGKSRSFLIAFVGFMVSMGYATGSFSSGFIIKKLGYGWSLGISSIACVLTMAILYFVEETLQEEKRTRLECNVKSYLRNLVQFYIDDDPVNQNSSKWKYIFSLAALVCTLLPRLGSFSVEIYYIMNSPFCFTPVTIGIFQTSKSIGSDCIILMGIKIMQYKLSDEMISLVGTLSAVVSFIMIGLAKSTDFFIIGKVYNYYYGYV
jgi:MFS family permease